MSRLGGRLSAGALLFGTVCIQSAVIVENAILFCKLSCFLLGDSFEVSPEVIVQRFFLLERIHFHQPGFLKSEPRKQSQELSLSTNSDSPCSF